jgi:AraC family transcriptional regulator of adaptative response / DNA-3-methyladenine glycosylase II
MLRFLGARAIPGVEHVAGMAVRRSVRAGVLAPVSGWLEASFEAGSDTRAPHVRLQYAPSLAPHSARVVAVVRRWLDLDANPDTIDAALADLPGEPGLRLPGSVDSFEMVVRAVLGQQVTVAAARTLARRFADRFGEPLVTPWPEVTHAFPGPERIAATAMEEIAELGIIRSRAGAIQALAQAWPAATHHLQERREPEPLIEMLKSLPGIGPWTAHYIAMRAMSWPDAFPPNDVAVLNAARPLFGVTTQREADALCERWRPWRAYAVLRLWNSLA